VAVHSLFAQSPRFVQAPANCGLTLFGSPDGIKNNQMLVGDPDTGEIRRFLTGPRGCEITGVITTPDQRTMFVNVQHPGESTTFWSNQFGVPSTSNPTTVSTWPALPGDTRPRPATIVIRKLDGGKIGT
jgi:secreted PhoX family phosphatase